MFVTKEKSDRIQKIGYQRKPHDSSREVFCVPGMILILLVKVKSRVFTARCTQRGQSLLTGDDPLSEGTVPFAMQAESPANIRQDLQ